jgi:preprotein translocase subunit YajC
LTIYDATAWLAADPPAGGGGSNYFMLIMMAGIVAVMFFMSRRNKKQQQSQQDFRDSLAPGQRVMTAGGMVGVISDVEGDVVTIMSPAGDQSAYVRRAIRSLVPDEEWEAMLRPYAADEEDEDEDEDEVAAGPGDAALDDVVPEDVAEAEEAGAAGDAEADPDAAGGEAPLKDKD